MTSMEKFRLNKLTSILEILSYRLHYTCVAFHRYGLSHDFSDV